MQSGRLKQTLQVGRCFVAYLGHSKLLGALQTHGNAERMKDDQMRVQGTRDLFIQPVARVGNTHFFFR